MEDRAQIITRNLFQWVGIPFMLGLVGFFFIGPSIGLGEDKEEKQEPVVQQAAVVAVKDDTEVPEEWIEPSPPQGSPLVIDPDDEIEVTDEEEVTEEDRPIPPPIRFDGADGDEAGIGGMIRPPVKDDSNDDDDKQTTMAMATTAN